MDGRTLTVREAMIRAAENGRTEGWPRCYYWAAVWLRLFARTSKIPSEAMQQSRSQLSLYRDIESSPQHYRSILRPGGMSDWQWFQKTKETP